MFVRFPAPATKFLFARCALAVANERNEPLGPVILAGVSQVAETGHKVADDDAVVLSVDAKPAPDGIGVSCLVRTVLQGCVMEFVGADRRTSAASGGCRPQAVPRLL